MFLITKKVSQDFAIQQDCVFKMIYQTIKAGELVFLDEEAELKKAWGARIKKPAEYVSDFTTIKKYMMKDGAILYESDELKIVAISPYNPIRDAFTKLACEVMGLPFDEDLTKKRGNGKDEFVGLVVMIKDDSFAHRFVEDYEEMCRRQRKLNFFEDVGVLDDEGLDL